MAKLPRVGDRVIVEFGGRDQEGKVFYVSRTPPMVGVEIWSDGDEEPLRFTSRASRVRPAAPVTR